VIAIAKPGNDRKLAANYHPTSLLSTCYKLLERLALQRVSPTADEVLSLNQAGFRSNGSTVDQVAALTNDIENGYQQKLKTEAVVLDLIDTYDTIWHTALMAKLSKNTSYGLLDWWM